MPSLRLVSILVSILRRNRGFSHTIPQGHVEPGFSVGTFSVGPCSGPRATASLRTGVDAGSANTSRWTLDKPL